MKNSHRFQHPRRNSSGRLRSKLWHTCYNARPSQTMVASWWRPSVRRTHRRLAHLLDGVAVNDWIFVSTSLFWALPHSKNKSPVTKYYLPKVPKVGKMRSIWKLTNYHRKPTSFNHQSLREIMLLFSVILISLLIYKECRFYFTQNSTIWW